MHLKSIEMIGFKSFAEKTKLAFEPGMTAIVGPNGCGKSNVSDAIRWVLGEQSAKALRGSKMEDCIFNGTQNRKPLGMAEVNITFTNCENVLKTAFHEVTITRRVFRSGEGQYFINKTPCRLRDIQRLFMDTGVGTSSYSFMAQGRIDQILSARPEDRRSIFEEASGITKYKADKTEALRKLAHTEANLLRLADVIREVKRQIGSLQRQAGKARRYKDLKDEMRILDLYAARCRVRAFDGQRNELENRIKQWTEHATNLHGIIDRADEQLHTRREEILQVERNISAAMEAMVQARSRLERTQDQIRMNTQRIEEYRTLAERDTREIDELNRQLHQRQETLGLLQSELPALEQQRNDTRDELERTTAQFDSHRQEIDSLRKRVQQLREETVSLESRSSRVHNELMQIDNQERTTIVQRERLTAEKQQFTMVCASFKQRIAEQEQARIEREQSVDTAAVASARLDEARKQIAGQIAETQQQRAQLQSKLAGFEARLEMLGDEEEVKHDYPGGAQLLLDPSNPLEAAPKAILGPLTSHFSVPEAYTRATETALRSMLDSIVVGDRAEAASLLEKIQVAGKGSARIVPCDAPTPQSAQPIPAGTQALLSLIEPSNAAIHTLMQQLIGNVLLVERLDDTTRALQKDWSLVTPDGQMLHRNGLLEFHMSEPGASNPLRRRQAMDAATQAMTDLQQQLATCDATLQKLREDQQKQDQALIEARRLLDAARREFAQMEGEMQVMHREAKTAAQRLETVTWELEEILKTGSRWEEDKNRLTQSQKEIRQARETVAQEMQTANQQLQRLESQYGDLQVQLTERRVAFSSAEQRVIQSQAQRENTCQRIQEIEATLAGRQEGIQTYSTNQRDLEKAIAEATAQIGEMEAKVKAHEEEAVAARASRSVHATALTEAEQQLAAQRTELETLQTDKGTAEVQAAEVRLRRQNLCDRIYTDYRLALEDILTAQEPQWQDGQDPMDLDTIETHVAELRTKLDAMGPVNLVAIEEYQEHEERYTFLSQQETDLLKAKQQLTEMIEKINETTSSMFQATFEEANANFEQMFTKLFNGGSAKLVLVNEEDVLECGIEIIARPPGKRLQNISLLSGGERTLTAVALLFAIYQIKPSPFCLLDELDAPLDDTNIGRFTEVLKQFLHQSQFVVITHNRRTISVSDVIYGVTMPEQGISRIMSMKFRNEKGGLVAENESDTPLLKE